MINKTTKERLALLCLQYTKLAKENKEALREIALAEISEMVYNSNAIENSTLSLDQTEAIILHHTVLKQLNTREVHEAQNLARVTTQLLTEPMERISVKQILDLHRTLLTGIEDGVAGKFRSGKEWVRVGSHLGANPTFVPKLMEEAVNRYTNSKEFFLDNIAWFHAEFETIHPFVDGNGRIGRVLINKQLMELNLPPIIIQNKSKNKDYYSLFETYHRSMKFDGFTELFALLLMESLHKRIALLENGSIILLSRWAQQNGVKGNVAANKAKRQTIPAFRLKEKWMIAESYRENTEEIDTFHA